MRTVPVVLEIAERVRALAAPGRVDRRLHEPGRDRHPGAARRGTPCDRALQRRDHGAARDSAPPGHRAGARARRPRRAQPPDVGAACPRRRRGQAAGPPRRARRRARGTRGAAAAAARGARRDPVVLPPLLLRARRRPRRAARRRAACRRSRGDRDAAARDLPRCGGRREAGAARAARRRVLQRGRDRRSIASLVGGHRRRAGRRRPKRRGASRASRTTTSSSCPRASGTTGAEPLPQAPLAPELLGLVQHVAAYERLTACAAVTRDPTTARKALLTHPLIGQDDLSGALLESLLAEEPLLLAGVTGAMSDRIVLAVDGGNSKTDLALVRADGALLAHVRGPLSSPHHLGLEASVALLQQLLDEALGRGRRERIAARGRPGVPRRRGLPGRGGVAPRSARAAALRRARRRRQRHVRGAPRRNRARLGRRRRLRGRHQLRRRRPGRVAGALPGARGDHRRLGRRLRRRARGALRRPPGARTDAGRGRASSRRCRGTSGSTRRVDSPRRCTPAGSRTGG